MQVQTASHYAHRHHPLFITNTDWMDGLFLKVNLKTYKVDKADWVYMSTSMHGNQTRKNRTENLPRILVRRKVKHPHLDSRKQKTHNAMMTTAPTDLSSCHW